MKYSFVLLFSAILLFGCGKKSSDQSAEKTDKFAYDTTSLKTEPVKDEGQKFLLRYEFEKGTKYHYRLTSISQDDQIIQADSTFPSNMLQTVVYLIDIGLNDVDKDSVMELSCNINSIKLDATVNGQKYSYQSGVTKDSAERVKYTEYESLVNNPFSVRVSKIGEILEVFRADKIVGKYLDLKGFADSATTQEKDMLRQNIVEGALKPIMIQLFRKIPEKVIAKDSTWSFSQPPSRFLIYTAKNTNMYKIDDLEMYGPDKLAVIDAGLQSVMTGSDSYNDRGVKYTFIKPKTSGSGKIYFNLTKGLIQRSKTSTKVEISYSMEMNTAKGLQKGHKNEVIQSSNILELL